MVRRLVCQRFKPNGYKTPFQLLSWVQWYRTFRNQCGSLRFRRRLPPCVQKKGNDVCLFPLTAVAVGSICWPGVVMWSWFQWWAFSTKRSVHNSFTEAQNRYKLFFILKVVSQGKGLCCRRDLYTRMPLPLPLLPWMHLLSRWSEC